MDTRTRAGLFLAALLLLADVGLILSFPSRGGSERFIFRTMEEIALHRQAIDYEVSLCEDALRKKSRKGVPDSI